jgi:hypothetical protein
MSETLSGTAATLRRSGAQIGEAASQLSGTRVAPDAFGAGGPGRLGQLGLELHRRLQDAIEARAREARAQAARLAEAADAVERAGRGYAEIDRPPRPSGGR